ncbi:hypothetical protein HZA97_09945 [Candidatus Woesearchaeota archaeon]|nr:hypothetical protein [Candidatus Woesearchaeota archaeon]
MFKRIVSIAAICTILGIGGYYALDRVKNHKFEPETHEIIQLPKETSSEIVEYKVIKLNEVLLKILTTNPNSINEEKIRTYLQSQGKDDLKPNPKEDSLNLISIINNDFNETDYENSIVFWSGAWNENETTYNQESESFHCTQILLRSLNRPYVAAYQIIPKEYTDKNFLKNLPEDTQIPVLLVFDDGFDGKSDELHEGSISKKDLTYSCFDLSKFKGEVIFDKTKNNENAKSLAELLIASIENGPSRVADDCIKRLFNKQY